MGMVVIQPYVLVSNLKETKTRFLYSTGYPNSLKYIKQDLLLTLVLVRLHNFLNYYPSINIAYYFANWFDKIF